MSLTDARRMYVLLRDAGRQGVHSHDLRRMGVSGNPSQRAKDIASKGVALATKRESRNGRPGARYWLAELAPSDAERVRPNRDAEADVEPTSAMSPPRAVAGVSSSPATEISWVRDYRSPEGFAKGWQRLERRAT